MKFAEKLDEFLECLKGNDEGSDIHLGGLYNNKFKELKIKLSMQRDGFKFSDYSISFEIPKDNKDEQITLIATPKVAKPKGIVRRDRPKKAGESSQMGIPLIPLTRLTTQISIKELTELFNEVEVRSNEKEFLERVLIAENFKPQLSLHESTSTWRFQLPSDLGRLGAIKEFNLNLTGRTQVLLYKRVGNNDYFNSEKTKLYLYKDDDGIFYQIAGQKKYLEEGTLTELLKTKEFYPDYNRARCKDDRICEPLLEYTSKEGHTFSGDLKLHAKEKEEADQAVRNWVKKAIHIDPKINIDERSFEVIISRKEFANQVKSSQAVEQRSASDRADQKTESSLGSVTSSNTTASQQETRSVEFSSQSEAVSSSLSKTSSLFGSTNSTPTLVESQQIRTEHVSAESVSDSKDAKKSSSESISDSRDAKKSSL